jgi:hypothetical protein
MAGRKEQLMPCPVTTINPNRNYCGTTANPNHYHPGIPGHPPPLSDPYVPDEKIDHEFITYHALANGLDPSIQCAEYDRANNVFYGDGRPWWMYKFRKHVAKDGTE